MTILQVGDEIEFLLNLKSDEDLLFRVSVYEVDGDQIIISQPISKGSTYPVSRGTVGEIRFVQHNHGMYYFTARVVERTMVDGLLALRLERNSDVRKVQRRHFFRVPVSEKGELIFKDKIYRFYTKDISGGGMLISTDEDIVVGTEIDGSLLLDGRQINFTSKVVRNIKNKDRYTLGLYFTNISSSDENKIISFCFDRQRKLKVK